MAMRPAEEEEPAIPKRRLWPFLAIVLALLATGASAAYLIASRPDPLGVLIAVDLEGSWWQGSAPAATLTDELAVRLQKLGFQPIQAGDPEVARVLERSPTPAEAAAKLRAAFVLSANLDPEVVEHPAYFEARVRGKLALAWRDEPAREVTELSTWGGARQRDRALTLVAENLAEVALDAALPALMAHHSLEAIVAGPATERAKLLLAKGTVESRAAKLDEAQKKYSELAERHRSEQHGPLPVSLHGRIEEALSLCGAGPEGFLVKAAPVRPLFVAGEAELGSASELERLIWLPPTGEPRLLFSGYHVYGYASAGSRGQPVVLVEDLFGWAKTVTLIEAGAAARRLTIDPKRRLADPKIAPDGKAVALWARPKAYAPAALLVLALPGGETLYESDPGLGGFAWLGHRTLAYLERPASGEQPQKLVLLDLEPKPPARREAYTTAAGESLSAPASNGTVVAFQRSAEDGKHLALFERDSDSLASFDVGGWIENPAVSPDGGLVVFERAGEIALFSRSTGGTRALTKNSFSDRYPIFSADGKRIAFESRDRDPNFSRRSLAVIASVPVPAP
jgi:hypothetical protein